VRETSTAAAGLVGSEDRSVRAGEPPARDLVACGPPADHTFGIEPVACCAL